MYPIRNILFLWSLAFFGCITKEGKTSLSRLTTDSLEQKQLIKKDTLTLPKDFSLEKKMTDAGLVNIHDIDSTIKVDLKYSTTDNFLVADVYGDLTNCYLQRDVAKKLALAQLFLKSSMPYYSLIVFDGARPTSVQKMMWDMLEMPIKEETKYLSNPNAGSLHNFGAAVDISIADENGLELDMGTKFDYFGELAYPIMEAKMKQEGKLTEEQLENRKLLRSVMQQAGFFNIETEWWHFNSCSRNSATEKYSIIN